MHCLQTQRALGPSLMQQPQVRSVPCVTRACRPLWLHTVPSTSTTTNSSSRLLAQQPPCPRRHIVQPLSRTRSTTNTPATPAAATPASATDDDAARAARLAAPVVVVGGGPVGLSTAIMLARRGYTNIKVGGSCVLVLWSLELSNARCVLRLHEARAS